MHRFAYVIVCLGLLETIAVADDAPAAPAPDAPSAPAASAPMPPAAPAVAVEPPMEAGPQFRNGFSASIGEEFGSGPSSGLSGQLYGVDWRIGAQINDSFAVYLDTHLSAGTAKIGASSGVTANFASAAVGEYTLAHRLFFAGGVGYGVLNNPSGALAQVRAGWYPFGHASAEKIRRLDVALDARWYFAGDQVGTVTQLAITIGYDRF